MNTDPELRQLFLANVQRLAEITAALGIPGDEPVEKIVAYIRRLKADAARNLPKPRPSNEGSSL